MPEFRFSAKPNKAHMINWRSWGKDAFEQASKENKPVFLSLAAVWCHWCHVMDETTFSHIPSIDYLNQNFIPIRVDTDKRPDLQNRYIMDGWPTSAFLTDEADLIKSTTYVPPEEFYRLLTQINEEWSHHQEEIKEQTASRRQEILASVLQENPSSLHKSTIDAIIEQYLKTFDDKFGGFGVATKFPASMTLELFMREYQVRGDSNLLAMVTTTLDKMAEGEIFDEEQGGFFRYATERDWSSPHTEKMLGENAGIIMNYLHAFEITKSEKYHDVAVKCLDYVDKKLANHPVGGFYGSQDADEGLVDKIIYTDSNCQMISTYLEASRILSKSVIPREPTPNKYLTYARDSLRYLISNCLSNTGAAHYYSEEDGANIFGLLADQVWMLHALIDIYEHDPEVDYLTQANDIVDAIINRLAMPTGRQAGNGSFFDKPKNPDDIGNMEIRYKPVKENALLALALQRFSVLSNSKDLADMAKNILSSFSFENFKGDFISMAPYGLALSEVLGEELRKAA